MKRRTRRARRIRWRAIVALLVVAGLGAGGYVMTRSRLFGLDDIVVVGSSRDAVIAASGLQVGDNVMKLDLDAVAERIEFLPNVATARVERFGSLGLRITVVERRPVLAVEAGGRRWLVDQDGVPIAQTAGRFPVLRMPGVTPDGMRVGSVAPVLAVWRALPRTMRARVTAFEFVGDDVVFALGSVRVIFGSADRAAEKVHAIQAIAARASEQRRDVIEIDVRAPQRPAARIE